MKRKRAVWRFVFTALLLLAPAGCRPAPGDASTCTVVFEDNPALFFYRQTYEVPRGGDLAVSVGVPAGRRIASVSYERCIVSGKTGSSASYDYYSLTLQQVRYPAVIRLATAPARAITYHPAPGGAEPFTVQDTGPHLRSNTLAYQVQFAREGHVPIGWNTASDGSGVHIGFGSRADHGGAEHLDLYLEQLPCAPEADFTYQITAAGTAVVTGGQAAGDELVVPSTLGGAHATAIAAGAFGDVAVETLVLPPSLKTVEPGAFRSLRAKDFYFFDDLDEVGEDSFGTYEITRLHVNAMREPVYSGSFFDTFPDKVDYLRTLAEEDKIILFCGSSARFGYSSPMLEASFPGYRVANMGVLAYSNMLPQAEIVLRYVKEGDVLLSSPELDAIAQQFCGETDWDKETFCLAESDYDLLALLDCSAYTNLFGAFARYQDSRFGMEPRSYDDSPAYYDEDGVRQEQTSYNLNGDYILYRENNTAGKNFGVKRAYYNASHIREADWQGINALYDAFAARGVSVFFTYSPRSRTSISPDSTPESIAELDALFRSTLHVPVISSIESSLMDPLYFFGTDNHLSTEGVRLHTQQVIADLQAVMEGPP